MRRCAQCESKWVLARGDLQRYLLVTFRTATGTLADFGIEPTAPKTKTAEVKAAAAAKAKSTRDARGLSASASALSVKGDVTGVAHDARHRSPCAAAAAAAAAADPARGKP